MNNLLREITDAEREDPRFWHRVDGVLVKPDPKQRVWTTIPSDSSAAEQQGE